MVSTPGGGSLAQSAQTALALLKPLLVGASDLRRDALAGTGVARLLAGRVGARRRYRYRTHLSTSPFAGWPSSPLSSVSPWSSRVTDRNESRSVEASSCPRSGYREIGASRSPWLRASVASVGRRQFACGFAMLCPRGRRPSTGAHMPLDRDHDRSEPAAPLCVRVSVPLWLPIIGDCSQQMSAIRFDEVSFHYELAPETAALDQLNLEVAPGLTRARDGPQRLRQVHAVQADRWLRAPPVRGVASGIGRGRRVERRGQVQSASWPRTSASSSRTRSIS